MKVLGYHGTSQERAAKIVAEGFKTPEDGNGWLGNGVYFFQETGLSQGPAEAYNFAKYVRNYDTPQVLMSDITCNDDEHVIDLLKNIKDRELFDQCKESAYKLHLQSKTTKKFSEKVIFQIIESQCKPKIIRALIDGYRESRYTSFVVRRPEVVICVKDCSCIQDSAIAPHKG
jgi:hypothetical protein